MRTFRRLALSFPETEEQDHHGIPSLRVRGRIIATIPDARHVRIMADEHDIRSIIEVDPTTFAAMYWGGRLACVVVDLRSAAAADIRDLLDCAWRRKAPASLMRELAGPQHATMPGNET
jgi:hypothetical protein